MNLIINTLESIKDIELLEQKLKSGVVEYEIVNTADMKI